MVITEEHESMEKGRKEARIGLDSEDEIINMINTSHEFQGLVGRCLTTLGLRPQGRIVAYKDSVKTDIFIRINSEIGVSLKSSTKTSFHQLDRRRLDNWKAFTNMPDNVFETMKDAILRVSKNPSDKFILEGDRNRIMSFFAQHLRIILDEVFRKGEDKLKLLMINDKRVRKIYLFRMEDTLNFLFENAHGNISFTDKGIIRLGGFVTVQRKGGDGKHIPIPKTDWKHPGNQIQFKFSPLKFAEHCEKTNAIRFCVIEY